MIVNSLAYLVPSESTTVSGQTPIAQKIDELLALDTLSPFERGFLLRIKCRDTEVIWADELAEVAHIWQIRMEDSQS